MKAAIFQGVGKVSIESVPDPKVGSEDDAIVRVTAASICGTDVRLYGGTMNALAPLQAGDPIGHEFVGVVEEVGSNVRNVLVGQRVVSPFSTHCGSCWHCEHDLFQRCEKVRIFGCGNAWGSLGGGQAEFVRVPSADRTLLALDERVTDEEATVLPDCLTGVWAGMRFLRGGESVAVVGCGAVGIAAIMCARLRGAGMIIAMDRHADRLARAERAGAIPVNCAIDDPLEAVRARTNGRGVDVGVEAAGKIGGFAATFPLVRAYGSLVILGYVDPAEAYSIGAIALSHVTIRPAIIPAIRRVQHEVMNLIADRRLDPSLLLSHTLPLGQVPRAYEMLSRREDGVVKVVLKP